MAGMVAARCTGRGFDCHHTESGRLSHADQT
jgi:hypothetical protein